MSAAESTAVLIPKLQATALKETEYFDLVSDMKVIDSVNLGPTLIIHGIHPKRGEVMLVNSAVGLHAVIQ